MIATLKRWIDDLVWGDLLKEYGLAGRVVTGMSRNLYAVLRDIFLGQLTLRAMSLVYTTLLSLVPLLAFDDKGFRLGWGGGYYDRTLAQLRSAGPVIAVGTAFDGQHVDNVPHTSHDQPLDWIVTEESIVEPG